MEHEIPTSAAPPQSQCIAVLGAGSWGTALSRLLARGGHTVRLWDRLPERSHAVAASYRQEFGDGRLTSADDLAAAVGSGSERGCGCGCGYVVVAVASPGVAPLAGRIAAALPPGTRVVSATKGLDAETGAAMSELLLGALAGRAHGGVAVLSGPNLAAEVERGAPTVAVAASTDAAVARGVQQLLSGAGRFRVYTHSDVRGVELAGALKNVLAIGAGLSDGLGYGDNAKAALMTRGLMEMSRLGVAAGGQMLTFLGIAGVGDLMATASSRLSRNYRAGRGLAAGVPLASVLAELGHVAEGVETAVAARLLSRRYGVAMPLFDALHAVIHEGKPALSAVDELMARPPRDEYADMPAPPNAP